MYSQTYVYVYIYIYTSGGFISLPGALCSSQIAVPATCPQKTSNGEESHQLPPTDAKSSPDAGHTTYICFSMYANWYCAMHVCMYVCMY